MPLPEGRQPLSDQDMIVLLYNMSKDLLPRDLILSDELRQTADRLNQLSNKEKANREK